MSRKTKEEKCCGTCNFSPEEAPGICTNCKRHPDPMRRGKKDHWMSLKEWADETLEEIKDV